MIFSCDKFFDGVLSVIVIGLVVVVMIDGKVKQAASIQYRAIQRG